MSRLITQREIAEKLNIPKCSVSVALRKLKPITKIGRENAYNTTQAWKQMLRWYCWEYEDAECKANAKLGKLEDIRENASMLYDMARREEDREGDEE